MNQHVSIIDCLDDLKKRGYESDFGTDQDCLYCGDLDLRLNPGEFTVDEIHLFKEDLNPNNSSVVYAISFCTGIKGTLVDAFGTYAQHLNPAMLKELEQHNKVMN